ncbi:hypothetical protein AB1Y20_002997 [Prymnesium parvum]|uniref:Right handed beta helix domain-containing protein n=1 Tax=Prymnesium parvum TaxID=97485 RepID=A0AB34JCU4_PRYPA
MLWGHWIFLPCVLAATQQQGSALISSADALHASLSNRAIRTVVLTEGEYFLKETLTISRDVVLRAETAGTVVLNALGSRTTPRGVLAVVNGTVELEGLDITGGDKGGGVHVAGGVVTITSCNIYRNTAVSGGGLAVTGGAVTTFFCNFFDNEALQASAQPSLVARSCCRANSKRLDSCFQGGGVYVSSAGGLSIFNGYISNNVAVSSGANLRVENTSTAVNVIVRLVTLRTLGVAFITPTSIDP